MEWVYFILSNKSDLYCRIKHSLFSHVNVFIGSRFCLYFQIRSMIMIQKRVMNAERCEAAIKFDLETFHFCVSLDILPI